MGAEDRTMQGGEFPTTFFEEKIFWLDLGSDLK